MEMRTSMFARLSIACVAALLTFGCGSNGPQTGGNLGGNGGSDDAGTPRADADTEPQDTSDPVDSTADPPPPEDGGSPDASPSDTSADTSDRDSGRDGGTPSDGTSDASTDTERRDGGTVRDGGDVRDGGTRDAMPDGGNLDATTDTGPDAASPDASDAAVDGGGVRDGGRDADTSGRDADATVRDGGRSDVDGGTSPRDTGSTSDASGRPDADTSGGGSPSACTSQTTCNNNRYCDYPSNSCGTGGATGRCRLRPRRCSPRSNPVCGCDDTTYVNACRAYAAGVDIAYRGRCRQTSTCDGETCSGREYCNYPDDNCGSGQSGSCRMRPTLCPGRRSPVCGCDGRTYKNGCIARKKGVDVEHTGPCRSP